MLTIASGTRYFHAKFISRSTRIRGRVALIQNIRKMKKSTLARKTGIRIRSTKTYEKVVPPEQVVGELDERDRRAAAQEQRRRQATDREHAQVLGQEEEAEPHARSTRCGSRR